MKIDILIYIVTQTNAHNLESTNEIIIFLI
jgi:hypothetical protein